MNTKPSQLGELKYTFETEWYDQQACIIREYRLIYFPNLRAIEMFDVKNNRQFLKRQEMPDLCLDDFFIGSQVTILSRVLKVRDYGDVHTRTRFEQDRQRTFAMIKPDAYNNIGKIIDAVFANGFRLNKLKMSRFSPATVDVFYREHREKPFFPNLQQFMVTDVSVGMELVAQDAVSKWRQCLGPTNSENARAQASGSLRALFGTDGTRNACHGSDSVGSFKRESDFWFMGGAAKN